MTVKQIRLIKPWNSVQQGRVLQVLQPGEDVRKGAVDERRAEALVTQGLAADVDAVPPMPPPADDKTPPKGKE